MSKKRCGTPMPAAAMIVSADPCCLRCQFGERHGFGSITEAIGVFCQRDSHAETGTPADRRACGAVQHDRVDVGESPRRLAQRARPAAPSRCRARVRQSRASSISRASARCCRPSSAITTSHVGAELQQQLRRAGPARTDRDRGAGGAAISSGSSPTSVARSSGLDEARCTLACRRSRATRRPESSRAAAATAHEFDRQRRLAGAADVEIADDDHRCINACRRAASRGA